MIEQASGNIQKNSTGSGKILLALLPFWDPQMCSLGMGCLKSYLQRHGYRVKAVDANLEPGFRELYDAYYDLLKKYVPKDKQGNIFNIGNQVLRNHMMAHLNGPDHPRYRELIKILVQQTFFTDFEDEKVQELEEILKAFFARLKVYFTGLLEREKPTVLGLSVYGDTLAASMLGFKLAKKWNPSTKTVMGGGIFADQLAPGSPNLEFFVEKSGDYIDKIIIGEGEDLLLKFLRGQLDQTGKVVGLPDIDGHTVDLSRVDVPDFSDFDLLHYPHLGHYGARSCPFQCTFCSETINWGKYRKKKISQLVKEFIELYNRHSYQLFLLTDSTLNPIVSDLSGELIKAGVSIYWDGFLRADKHVGNRENTLLWRRGGFYRAKLGLESGSQRILDLMRKRITVEQAEKALINLAYAGIKTTTFWLFGHPGETEKDFRLTLDFIERMKDNIYEADCNPFNYYLTGQVNSDEWLKNNKGVLLYPQWATDMLVSQTWMMEGEPSRQETFERVNRFVKHCKKLGIPNPYSLKEINKADERWKSLHKNAVPCLVDLNNKDIYIDENTRVKELIFSDKIDLANEGFEF